MSDAEILALLENARQGFENYLTVNEATSLFREQLEVQFSPSYSLDAQIGLVIDDGSLDAILG